jgi:hypothetical protein
MFLKYGFWLALAAMLLGVGYAGYQARNDRIRTLGSPGSVNQQTGSCGANVNGNGDTASVDCDQKPAGAK